ncbi:MAG: hypothetical protein FJ296_11525, partial [Planctomycetes bacterium]|nr:hypothetical protein [Planctomycetota bacterium]
MHGPAHGRRAAVQHAHLQPDRGGGRLADLQRAVPGAAVAGGGGALRPAARGAAGRLAGGALLRLVQPRAAGQRARGLLPGGDGGRAGAGRPQPGGAQVALAPGGFTRGRRWLGAAEGLGTALIVLAAVAVVTYAATRPTLRARLDLTEGEQYALSEQTHQLLGALEQPVTVTLLMQPEASRIPNGLYEVQARAIRYADNLLREYELASGGRVAVRRLSPQADRLEAEALVRELNLTRYNVAVVRGAQRHRVVTLEELATIDRGRSEPGVIEPAQLVELHGEAPLTSALLDVGQADPPRVGFVRGF